MLHVHLTQRFIYDRHGLYYTRTTRKETRESQVHAIRTVLQGDRSLMLLLSTRHTCPRIHIRVYKSNTYRIRTDRSVSIARGNGDARRAHPSPETLVFRSNHLAIDRIAIGNKLLSGNQDNKRGLITIYKRCNGP